MKSCYLDRPACLFEKVLDVLLRSPAISQVQLDARLEGLGKIELADIRDGAVDCPVGRLQPACENQTLDAESSLVDRPLTLLRLLLKPRPFARSRQQIYQLLIARHDVERLFETIDGGAEELVAEETPALFAQGIDLSGPQEASELGDLLLDLIESRVVTIELTRQRQRPCRLVRTFVLDVRPDGIDGLLDLSGTPLSLLVPDEAGFGFARESTLPLRALVRG